MIQSTDLSRLQTGLTLLENLEQKQHVLTNFTKLKVTTPFSKRFNDFIEDWYVDFLRKMSTTIKFVKIDDFRKDDIQGTFTSHLARLVAKDEIHVWTGASDKTIFGDPTINHKFRAWHDYTHLINKIGYDSVGESIVADIQKSELPFDWLFERELIHIEVVGQIHYHALHNSFVEDQRRFTVDYLSNPLIALR